MVCFHGKNYLLKLKKMGLSLSCIRGNSKNEPIEPLRIVPEAQEVPAQVEITELCDLTEKLIEKDENNCAKYIKYNVQNRNNRY